MDLYTSLNDEQLRAVRHNKGPLLILAGAGSGKTRVLTHRIAHLISQEGVSPWNIMAVTFTNKAAREMRQRVDDIVGFGAENIWVSTFHSTCVRILRRFIDSIGYNRNFTIYDTDDQRSLMKDIIKQLNYDSRMFNERKILSLISSQKDSLVTPQMYEKEVSGDYFCEKIAKAYSVYQERLMKNNALDFDDLIMKTVELFRQDGQALEYYRNRFHYIMVDEYQDTNTAQFELLHLLAEHTNEYGEIEKNICVVGDDDQSIYRFRGANTYNILNFEKIYKDATVIKLEQNYRSTKNILNAANEVICNNTNRKEKKLWSKNNEGAPLTLVRYGSDMEEAAGIVKTILQGVDSGENYRDYAILYRTNAQSRILEECLIHSDIPYKIVGGINFYSRKEIKDIIAYLKTIDNGLDDIAVKRIINVPKRGIGLTTIDRISSFASMHEISFFEACQNAEHVDGIGRALPKIQSFVSLIEHYRAILASEPDITIVKMVNTIIEDTEYTSLLENEGTDEARARIENIEEFINKAALFDEAYNSEASPDSQSPLSAFLENIALVADIDSVEDENNLVLLMTLHSAKGLEFTNVFMCGMEENLFPSSMVLSSYDDSELEEERRLCYVGITRAMKTLTLSCASRRMKNGELQINYPSRFLTELPRHLVKESASPGYSQTAVRNRSVPSSEYENCTSRNPPHNASYRPVGAKRSSKLFTYNPYISKGMKAKNTNTVIDYLIGDRVRH
ncbi:MAG: UvrD-helicase domain-containing protein, partial [Lachnospiraceae bacterium]|nr:UvrD-helicase domain-containing protein [Lachnospiraceae bacterium]